MQIMTVLLFPVDVLEVTLTFNLAGFKPFQTQLTL